MYEPKGTEKKVKCGNLGGEGTNRVKSKKAKHQEQQGESLYFRTQLNNAAGVTRGSKRRTQGSSCDDRRPRKKARDARVG